MPSTDIILLIAIFSHLPSTFDLERNIGLPLSSSILLIVKLPVLSTVPPPKAGAEYHALTSVSSLIIFLDLFLYNISIFHCKILNIGDTVT